MTDTKRGIDAFVGNLPFLGGRRIATQYGERYAEWLTERYGGTGDTDYVGYFFHRAEQLLAPAGTLGLIATSAIADGDNRRVILGQLLKRGLHIHSANTSVPWPGNAQVLIATLFLQRGLPDSVTRPRLLDGRAVPAINSRLKSGDEWPEPSSLPENASLALTGCFLRGAGFILEAAEAASLLTAHPEEAAVVHPFLTGDDLNGSPDHRPGRYVIDFANRTLDEARGFPTALGLVEERVRPGRERLKSTGADADHRKHWWRFANVRLELRQRAAALPRLLATARVSKHSTFAFVPADWTPSEQVVVFPLPSYTAFAVLQSRIHGLWLTQQATHMGQGLRYSAGECFAPFPFPNGDPTQTVDSLEQVGQTVYQARAALMRDRNLGLPALYNQLHDSQPTHRLASPAGRASGATSADAELHELRRLHEALDAAVLQAYGWHDLTAPAFGQTDSAFDDAVAGRLFALNAERNRAAQPAPGVRSETKSGLKSEEKSGVKPAKAQRGPGPTKAARRTPAAERKRGSR